MFFLDLCRSYTDNQISDRFNFFLIKKDRLFDLINVFYIVELTHPLVLIRYLFYFNELDEAVCKIVDAMLISTLLITIINVYTI